MKVLPKNTKLFPLFPTRKFFYPIRTESRGIREKIPQKSIRQTRRLSEKDGVQQNMPHSRAVTPIITLPNYSCTAILGKLRKEVFFCRLFRGKEKLSVHEIPSHYAPNRLKPPSFLHPREIGKETHKEARRKFQTVFLPHYRRAVPTLFLDVFLTPTPSI